MTKPTIYIHLGMPKTGTSALQAFFTTNVDLLRRDEIHYPFPHGFFQEYQTSSGNGLKISTIQGKNTLVQIKNTLDDVLSHGCSNILFSSEELFFDNDLFSFLKEEGYNVKCIIYLRRQDSFLNSVCLQLIKNHKKTEFNYNEWEGHAYYSNKLKFLEELFGLANVIVKPYEKQQFIGGSIFSDFLSIFGVELTSEYALPEKTVNPSLSPNYAELKRVCNTLPFSEDKLRNTFLDSLWTLSVQESGGKPFSNFYIFSPKERCDIMARYAEDNAAIARHYLGREHGQLFYDAMPDPNEAWDGVKKLDAATVAKCFGYLYVKENEELQQHAGRLNAQALRLEKLEKLVSINNPPVDDDFNHMRSRLNIPTGVQTADLYREMALVLEGQNQVEAAYFCMQKALQHRPTGEFIMNKCQEYKTRISNVTEPHSVSSASSDEIGELKNEIENLKKQLHEIVGSKAWSYCTSGVDALENNAKFRMLTKPFIHSLKNK